MATCESKRVNLLSTLKGTSETGQVIGLKTIAYTSL